MITDYAEPLLALKQEVKYLEDALLHKKYDKVPQILRNIEIERDLMDLWCWKQREPKK